MSRTYLGTNKGVARLRDGKLQLLGMEDHGIWAIHAVDGTGDAEGDTILAGSYGEGVFRSEDGGDTWVEANEGLTASALRSFLSDPECEEGVLCGTEPGRGFRSLDGGKSWEELEGIKDVPGCPDWFLPYSPRAGALRNFYSPPGRPEHLLASIEVGGLLDSRDGGETWERLDLYRDGIQDDDIHYVSGHPDNPDQLWLALGWASMRDRDVDRDALGGIGRSEDGGKTWRKVLEKDYTRAILVPPSAPDIVLAGPAKAVGQQGRIVISSDGGSSWEPAGEGIEEPMTDMVEVFLAGPDGSVWAICAAGRLFRAEPGEWVWQSVGLPEGITVESVCFVG
ncbi:MAG: hypothetical protein VCF24_23050 [Candidatus Latescibacterota bacterium]